MTGKLSVKHGRARADVNPWNFCEMGRPYAIVSSPMSAFGFLRKRCTQEA